MNDEILILGAGPAGMAAGMELTKAGRSVLVIEKNDQVGGLAKTIKFTEPDGIYRTDIGPHRFYSKNKYLYNFIEDLLGEDWIQVQRLTRFYVDGKFYYYPVRIWNVLSQIGLVSCFRIAFENFYEKIRSVIYPRKLHNFEDYVVSNFGRTLAEFNMINYTEKIWGIPCNEISIDWAIQRISGLSIRATICKALFKTKGPKTLVDTFYYPSRGCGLIYDAIQKRIEERGSSVLTNTQPTKISWEGKRVTSVDIQTADGTKSFSPKATITSIPVTSCLELFDPAPPEEVMNAATKLRFRSQVYLFLTVDKERVTEDNWVYFPDKHIPIGRITEMKNFSTQMAPEGKTSLFIEFFCFEGDDVWNASKDDLYEMAISTLEDVGILMRSDVMSVHHFRKSHVYPIYDLTYKENIDTILKWLDSFENLFTIGRPGRFRYTNQDHSLEMGILAAQSVLHGKRKELDIIDDEYFERGYTPS